MNVLSAPSFRTLICCVLLSIFPAVNAGTPPALTLFKGTIESIAGNTIFIRNVEGQASVLLSETTRILLNTTASLADVQPGQFVGSAASPGPDGRFHALEIHIFPESLRGLGEGHRDWFAADVTMTNGNIDRIDGTVAGSDGRTLMIRHSNGQQEIVIPVDTPVTRVAAGAPSDLMPGMQVSCLVRQGDDGMTAVLVSVNGHF